jgi:hypothetical protein
MRSRHTPSWLWGWLGEPVLSFLLTALIVVILPAVFVVLPYALAAYFGLFP